MSTWIEIHHGDDTLVKMLLAEPEKGGRKMGCVSIFLFAAFVYLAAWVPILGLFDVSGIPAKVAVGLFCLSAVAAAVWFQRRLPRTTRILAVPYWAGLLACHSVLLPMAFSMAPFYFALSLLAAAIVVLKWFVPKRFLPVMLAVAVAVTSMVVGADVRFYSRAAAVLVLALGGVATSVIWWLGQGSPFLRPSRLAVALATLSILLYPRSFLLYTLPFPEHLPAIVSQSGVRAVYSYKDKGIRDSIPAQVMFLARAPHSDRYIIGPQKPYHCLYVLRPGSAPGIELLELGARGTDNPFFDPSDPRRLYIGAGTRFHLVSLDPLEILASVHLKDAIQNLSYIRYDPKADRFFIAQDIGDRVFVVQRETMRVVTSLPSAAHSLIDDVWVDPVADLVFVDGRCFYLLGRRLDVYDRTTLESRGTYLQPWDYGFNDGAIDPERRRAYLASTITGRVRVLDMDSREVKDEFRLEVGIRNVALDSQRGWLLVSSYFKGRLFVYDVGRERLLGSIFLGKRLRWVHIDAENGKWYAATAAGGFEISPEETFPH